MHPKKSIWLTIRFKLNFILNQLLVAKVIIKLGNSFRNIVILKYQMSELCFYFVLFIVHKEDINYSYTHINFHCIKYYQIYLIVIVMHTCNVHLLSENNQIKCKWLFNYLHSRMRQILIQILFHFVREWKIFRNVLAGTECKCLISTKLQRRKKRFV